ncbi:MAG: ribosome assembly factor SBDS [Candidatus Pacearchaeota archaeon]
MVNTVARVKKTGKNFEIIVDLDNALKFRKGMSNFIEAEGSRVFSDSKKGLAASNSDLMAAFGTSDINTIAGMIVKGGEVLVTQEHRDEERDRKVKQVVDLIVRSATDQNGRPYTPEKIKNALEQAHVNIKNRSPESQLKEIILELSKIIPIKMETKTFEVTVPAMYTGQVYGIVNPYKEEEMWLDNGDLRINIALSGALVLSFFDKLNSATHGSAITKEIKR